MWACLSSSSCKSNKFQNTLKRASHTKTFVYIVSSCSQNPPSNPVEVLNYLERTSSPAGKGTFAHLFCTIPGNGTEDEQALNKISFYIESPYDLELFLRNKPVLATAECFVWCSFGLLLQRMEPGSRPLVLQMSFLLGTQMWVQRPLVFILL